MPKGEPHPAELKAGVALEVIRGEKTVNETAAEYGLSPCLVREWVTTAEGNLARVFVVADGEMAHERELAERKEEVDDLNRKINELTAERDNLQRDLLERYGIDI